MIAGLRIKRDRCVEKRRKAHGSSHGTRATKIKSSPSKAFVLEKGTWPTCGYESSLPGSAGSPSIAFKHRLIRRHDKRRSDKTYPARSSVPWNAAGFVFRHTTLETPRDKGKPMNEVATGRSGILEQTEETSPFFLQEKKNWRVDSEVGWSTTRGVIRRGILFSPW